MRLPNCHLLQSKQVYTCDFTQSFYNELYYEDFTSATGEFCYPCWTFTVKLHNCGCSYCVATGCSQDRKEAQQQQQVVLLHGCYLDAILRIGRSEEKEEEEYID